LSEIAILEKEVVELEKQVLSVYRHIFSRCLSSRPSCNAEQQNRAHMIWNGAQQHHMQHPQSQPELMKSRNVPGADILKDSWAPMHPPFGQGSRSTSNEEATASMGNLAHTRNLVHSKVESFSSAKRSFVDKEKMCRCQDNNSFGSHSPL
jgi:hypothetical protein